MNKSNTIINVSTEWIHDLHDENFSHIQTQYFKKASREKTREEATTAPDSGRENADPASGDGAGAGELSSAETVAAAEKIATTKTSIKAFAMLTCAIDEG